MAAERPFVVVRHLVVHRSAGGIIRAVQGNPSHVFSPSVAGEGGVGDVDVALRCPEVDPPRVLAPRVAV